MAFGSSKGSKKGSAAADSGKGRKGAAGRSANAGVARRSASEMAKLSLPVARVTRMIKQGRYAPHVSKYYVLKLTGIVEYVTAELLDAAMGEAKKRKRQRVVPRDFMLAVRGDEEFSTLFKNVQISSAGVAPCIHDSLTFRKGAAAKTKSTSKPKAPAAEGSSKGKSAKSKKNEKLSQAYGDQVDEEGSEVGEEDSGDEAEGEEDSGEEDEEMADAQEDEEEEDAPHPGKGSKDGSQSY